MPKLKANFSALNVAILKMHIQALNRQLISWPQMCHFSKCTCATQIDSQFLDPKCINFKNTLSMLNSTANFLALNVAILKTLIQGNNLPSTSWSLMWHFLEFILKFTFKVYKKIDIAGIYGPYQIRL